MDIPLLALWFVCGLGTAVLAATSPPTRSAAIGGAVGFLAGMWWIAQPFAPSAATVGLAASVVAGWELFRPAERPWTLAVAGLLAGIWTGVLHWQGVPTAAAVLAAVTLPAISAYLRKQRAAFAPALLREEALLFLIVLGVTAGAAPGIAEGWRAAGHLNVQGTGPGTSATTVMPMWTVLVASAALVSGGLFSMWSRR